MALLLLKLKNFYINQILPKISKLSLIIVNFLKKSNSKFHPLFHKFSHYNTLIYKKSGLSFLISKSIEFIKILLSGIRAKLALFTGSLIALTILFLSWITVQQQTSILTESYEKQAYISRKYIANLVTNLDNITQNLIRIEKFRTQIELQSKSRRKYKTSQVLQIEKKVDFFGFKTDLFGAMGKENIYRSKDTFYSQYLTKSDIETLEKKIKAEMDLAANREITDKEWKDLLSFARKYTELEADEKEKESKDTTLTKLRSELEHKVASFIISSKKKNIEELGLDTHRFRMQTFPLSKINLDTGIEPSFDTKVFNEESELAKLNESSEMKSSLEYAIQSVLEKPESNFLNYYESLNLQELDIQLLYSPLFKYPESTKRASKLLDFESSLSQYKDFLEVDRNISTKIKEIHPKIKARIDFLKTRKPPIPPNRDKIFINLYKDYNLEIANRDAAINELLEKFSITEDQFLGADSLRSLRESAWEDEILLRYRPDTSNLDRYVAEPEFREQYKKRWSELRAWVSEAKSELPSESLRKIIPDATIGKSRSEAEELLWDLDSTALYPIAEDSLAKTILSRNLTGIIRTIVDRTDGIQKIRENRNKAILSALIIGLLSIFLAIFISGIVVQKIKRIIKSAETVGSGDLEVTFEHGGEDEFGNLTIALNQMVSGLREREKIKGILGSMIDPVVVSEAMKDLQALKRGSEKNITAFFSDIASFSAISEKLSSPQLADLLNEYLSAMTIILKNYDGVLDKYIGDAIVGIFNSPIDVEDHVYKASLAALDMQFKLGELKKEWSLTNKYIPEARNMTFRIGLNTGLAKVGFMGTDALASYTMMGDTVNLAARLEAAGKDYGVDILASDSVYKEIQDRIYARKLDVVRVKGKTEPVVLYELLARKGEESTHIHTANQIYEDGFQLYLDRKWDLAIEAFLEYSKSKGREDKSAKLLIERCETYKKSPPPSDWDGVFTRTSK